MSRPSLSSSTSSSSPVAGAGAGAGAAAGSRLGRPSLAPRKSLIALRQAAAASSASAGALPPPPPLPTVGASATATATPKRSSLPHGASQSLEIGDTVSIDLPGSSLVGVLRFLGPVHFKEGQYAGLELIGDSFGKGKNNGEVQGRQYFATQPNNGMFCLASKVVKLNSEPSVCAVARPESALSAAGSLRSHSRSASRASESGDRPASRVSLGPTPSNAFTPVRSNMRARSNTSSSFHPSDSSSRPSSRVSTHHERTASENNAGVSTPGAGLSRSTVAPPSGLPSKMRTPSTAAPGSKLPFSGRKSFGFGGVQKGSTPAGAGAIPPVPRPPSTASRSRASSRASTLEDDVAEADSERRAKSSAEAAARAERMISVGSRAHRFLGLRGRDLNGPSSSSSSSASFASREADEVFGGATAKSRSATTSASATAVSASTAGRASPTKGRPSSPLKATLLGRPSLGGGNNTPTSAAGGLEALRKARASLPSASSGIPASGSGGSINNTPRPAKGRSSLYSYGSNSAESAAAAAAMPPPPSPGKLGATSRTTSGVRSTASPTRNLRSPSGTVDAGQGSERPPSSASTDEGKPRLTVRSALGGAGPHTPVKTSGAFSLASPTIKRPLLRPSLGSHSSSSSYNTAVDENGPAAADAEGEPGDQSFVRRHKLLEEMDLTPKRPGQAGSTAEDENRRSSSRLSAIDARPAPPASPGPDFIAQASVPLSLYEEAQQEVERLTAALAEAERKATAERAVRMEEDRVLRAALDSERARVKEEKEEWEDDRRLLRADEERRKREAENRERELRETTDQLKRDLEASKDLPRQIEALKGELKERDELAEQLKKTIEQRDQGKAEESGKVKILEAELNRAQEKMKRLESEHKAQVENLEKRIQDLCDDANEFSNLAKTHLEDALEEKRYEIENEYREDLRKTLSELAAVEAERDALLSKREAEDQERTLGNGRGSSAAGMPTTALSIENETLREQVSHLQERLGSVEEELALANMQAETDREAMQQKSQRIVENEANLKAEIKKLKAEIDRVNKEERAARQRIDDLNEVVEESKTALETERAEVERLRADLLGSSGGGMLPTTGQGAGGAPTPTLQDEAMQERAKRAEADKTKLEAEVERLNRLLEGARSGKKEAVRLVEEYKKSVEDKMDLIEDVRRELSDVEAEKAALELKLTQTARDGSGVEGGAMLVRSLRRTIDDKNKEVEMLKRTHMPLSDQLLELRKIHSDEVASKDDELRKLRASLAAVKASSKKSSDGPLERRALSPVVGQQASSIDASHASHGSGHSLIKERPLSISSITSRTSRNSIADSGSPDPRSDTHMVATQMSGLNYLVRQLTDENAKVKSQFRLLEQQSKEMVEEAKSEARISALTLESLRQDVQSLQSGDTSAVDLVQLRTEFSQRTASLEKQVQDAKAEIAKLQAASKEAAAQHRQTLDAQAKEISDLEHLVESQIYKLDEKEEMYQRLQRRLDRANAHIDELRVHIDTTSPAAGGIAKTPPGRRLSDAASIGTAREEEESPSQTQALRLRKTSGSSAGTTNAGGSMDSVGAHARSGSAVSVSGLSSSTATPSLSGPNSKATFPSFSGRKSSSSSSTTTIDNDLDDDEDDEDLENFCVLCNVQGHSVVNCTSDLVRPGTGPTVRSPTAGGGPAADDEDDVCDDCGESGHKLEDCPYADVF
ncbi:hypothetical protein OC842_006912 [Tilletia horrida]|uniref:CAP-Gly domain-containing protein n=1 Tax=Tilletia horrida TaxID=155126 RepID=A0AAN6G711_9BASI|nr:hypothetical protein OC842_006912 [Tilletia horrida]